MVWKLIGSFLMVELIIAMILSFSGVTYVDFEQNLLVLLRLVNTKMSQQFVLQIPSIPTEWVNTLGYLAAPGIGLILSLLQWFFGSLIGLINAATWFINQILYVVQWVVTLVGCLGDYARLISA